MKTIFLLLLVTLSAGAQSAIPDSVYLFSFFKGNGDDNRWIVYFDKYMDPTYGAVTSTDLVEWTDISDRITFPSGMRHGSVLVVRRAECERLQEE